MGLSLVHDLPREIRDEIYTYVLSSPTGSIVLCESYNRNGHYKLAPTSPLHALSNGVVPKTYEPDEMGLSLLRTCKQIHEETKNVFWKVNIYKVELPWLLYRSFTRLDLGICRNVTRVSMEVKYPQPTESKDEDLANTEKAFEELGKWARDWRLKTVTVIPGVNWSGVQFDRLMLLGRRSDVNNHADERFGRFLALLRAGSQFSLSGVVRKMTLDTKWPELDLGQKHAWMKVQDAKEGNINWVFTPATFLEQIHDAWNGDLYVDGKLCYRNRDLVAEPFKLEKDKN